MNPKQTIILAFNLFMGLSMSAQILTPAKWTCKLSTQDIKQGDLIEFIFKIQLNDTWHLYSNVQNYKIGPLPTTFEFEPSGSYKLVGDVVAIGAKKKYDDVFEVDVNYFENTAEFRQKVKLLSKNPLIKGSYTFQVCTTVDGKCILGDDEFEFKIKTTHQ
jgi:thiol:disulfide interchange protein DsbD